VQQSTVVSRPHLDPKKKPPKTREQGEKREREREREREKERKRRERKSGETREQGCAAIGAVTIV